MVGVRYNAGFGTRTEVFKTKKQAKIFCMRELDDIGYEVYFIKDNFKIRG